MSFAPSLHEPAPKRQSRKQLPDGPRVPGIVITARWMLHPLDFLDDCARRYGEVFTVRLPGLGTLVNFVNPEAVKEVFADSGEAMHAGQAANALRPFVGDRSVLVLDGREHMRQRKLLLPPFHGERMEAYGQAMIALTRESMQTWPIGRPFAIHTRMQEITMRVIVRTVFGVDAGEGFETLVAMLTELIEIATWPPLLLPPLQRDLGPWSPWGRYLRKQKVVNAMLSDQIRERKTVGTAGRSDVLSMLVDARDEAGQPMTEEEIRDELVTLLIAGHETTATGLAWAFRWLLDTPDAKARLLDELASVGEPTPERIAKLEYTDAVVRETLRLSPVLPLVGRVLQRPMTVGGWDLPAGIIAACPIYLSQRRPEAYPEPTRFKPERFLHRKFTPNEFYPFGGGVRRCIGMAFAMYEMKMVLATTLSRASLDLAPGLRSKVGRRHITLSPSDGTRVVCTRIDH